MDINTFMMMMASGSPGGGGGGPRDALVFDGVDDYLLMTFLNMSGDFLISGTMDVTTSGGGLVGGGGTSHFIRQNVGRTFSMRFGGGTIITTAALPANKEQVNFVVWRASGVVYYDFDDGVVTGSFANANTAGLVYIGTDSLTTPNYYNGKMYGTWTFEATGSATRVYDFDASDHGPGTVTVTETETADDAVGVNMPTDGSAWVTV